MRESNYSDSNSVQYSDDSSNKNEIEESTIIQKQVQSVRKKDDEEINMSTFSNSTISLNQSINIPEKANNNKEVNKENQKEEDKIIKNTNNNLKKKKTNLGNKINHMILDPDKSSHLYLKKDEQKSKQKNHTIYTIYKIGENKEEQILCSRRYKYFNQFYEVLKMRYPHYIYPKLNPKSIMAKVKDDPIFIEQRRKELEFFINEINTHEIIGKGEELKKFLYVTKFDKQYFYYPENVFDYPETLKKIEENKGIISKGMKSAKNLYNYFVGNKNQISSEREKAKIIFEKMKKLQKKIEKFNTTFEEIKNIYKSFKDEYKEKEYIANNFLYMKIEGNFENNFDKKKFNELVELNQNYSYEKSKLFLENLENKIVDPLNFCILYLYGEQKAINRYHNFLEKYEEIINYKKLEKDSKRIDIEQENIKKDIEIYENILLNEIEKIEDKTNKEFENIIHILIISLKDSTEEFVELYKNSNFIKK